MPMNSVKSEALEPTRVELERLSPLGRLLRWLPVYGLVILTVLLGLIFSLINIVGVEFLINFGGLGQLINDLAERYDLPGTYAAIAFVVLVSVVFFIATERIEKWLRPGA